MSNTRGFMQYWLPGALFFLILLALTGGQS